MADDVDTEKSCQNLWDEIEKTPYFRWMSEAGKMFKRVRDLAEQRGERDLADHAQSEIEIHYLGVKHPFISSDYRQRFDGMRLADFSAEQINYYEDRLHETANPFLKCRYADFLFECYLKECRITKFELGRMLVHLLQETGRSHLNEPEPEYPLCLYNLARAADVAIRLNDAELLTPIIGVLITVSQNLDGRGLRWVYDISRIMRSVFRSRQGATVSDETYSAVVRRVDDARAFFFESEELLMWHRYFCEELIAWGRLRQMADTALAPYLKEIGESYEREADVKTRKYGTNMFKASFLEKALMHYASIGETDKTAELKVRVREAYASCEEESHPVSWTLTIPMDEIEIRLSPYRALPMGDSLRLSGSDKSLVVDLASVVERTSEDKESSPFMFEISTFLQDGDRKVFQSDSELSRFQFLANMNYKITLLINTEPLLKEIFRVLIEERDMTHQGVICFFRTWPSLDEKNATILSVGIERFFAKDYVSALHVLVPQFESCLRRMFAQAGYATTTIRKGTAQHEQNLNHFLDREEVKKALGPNIHKYIEMVMVDQTGFNLRNDVAHGLIRPEKCNETTTLMVIHLFLILTQTQVAPWQAEQ